MFDEKELTTLIHIFRENYQMFYITFVSDMEEIEGSFDFSTVKLEDLHKFFAGYAKIWNINFIIPKVVGDKEHYWLIRRLDSLEF